MLDASALQRIIETAEQAASSGDFASAESLLREAARLQEAGLGALHPDLASTFNNLGVVCEKTNKLADAGQFYRRASTIASASLDPQHPLVTTSHNNLRDFYDAHGRAPEGSVTTDADVETVVARAEQTRSTPTIIEPIDGETPLTTIPAPLPTPRSSRALVGGGLVALALLVGLLATRSMRTPPGPRTAYESPRLPAQEAVSVPPSASPSTAGPPPPPAVDRSPERPVPPAIDTPRRAAPAVARTVDVQVLEAAVCRSLSTSVALWQCAPPADPAAPGLLYFYTRIAAPENVRVHHRWYRNGRLRQDVELAVGANPSAGYRTFSRQTVDDEGGGEWRVELVTADGALLREERIIVR